MPYLMVSGGMGVVERIFLALEYEDLFNISTLYLPEYMVSIKIKKNVRA